MTVGDFKTHVLEMSGAQSHFEFLERSAAHRTFWDKLNALGWSKKTKDVEETRDVDASAPLTEREWQQLEAEFRQLP
jgi:hypothetical protein